MWICNFHPCETQSTERKSTQGRELIERLIGLNVAPPMEVYSIIVLWVLCGCAHFRGLTSQRAAQCNGILISILVFPIKPTWHETFVACINYSRICVFVFSIFPAFPSHWFTDSVCMFYVHYLYSILHILRTYTLRVNVFAHTDTRIRHRAYSVRVPYI